MKHDKQIPVLLVGTKKGAFVFKGGANHDDWNVIGPFFKGCYIYHMVLDKRNARTIFITVNSGVWGPHIYKSQDLGRTWIDSTSPPYFSAEQDISVNLIWNIEPNPPTEPNVVYAGLGPAGLTVSYDHGKTWQPVNGINKHSTRNLWKPSAGGMCLHSIVINPLEPKMMYVGISSGGVFASNDGGDTWTPKNHGVRADFLPNKFPVVGQCTHKLLGRFNSTETLFQQSHCGVYRSRNRGDSWEDISNGLVGRFGYALALGSNGSIVYVFPEESETFHSTEGKMNVFRSKDSGDTWEALSTGLPTRHAYIHVMREGMCVNDQAPDEIFVGSYNGQIYYSLDGGLAWRSMGCSLPPILSVSFGMYDSGSENARKEKRVK